MKKSIKMLILALGLSAALMGCQGKEEAPATDAPAAEAPAESPAEENAAEEPAETPAEENAAEETETHAMSYISAEDTKAIVDGGEEKEYVLLDVRKAEDFEAGHTDNFSSADLDKAKEGDAADGKANLEKAIDEQTGGEGIGDREVLLMCYSGKSYAQAGTDLLINELGVNPDQIKTVEGGMEAYGKLN